MKNVKRRFDVINNSLFLRTGNLDYLRVTEAIITLCDEINLYAGDTEFIWNIGEFGECTLDELIVGAFWHYSEWHGGQSSMGYAALSALGTIFEPNMSSVEYDNPAYQALNLFAEQL